MLALKQMQRAAQLSEQVFFVLLTPISLALTLSGREL